MRGPRLQLVGEAEGQVADRDHQVAAHCSLHPPAQGGADFRVIKPFTLKVRCSLEIMSSDRGYGKASKRFERTELQACNCYLLKCIILYRFIY